MSKRVVFNFGNGNLIDGFPSVTVELWKNEPTPYKDFASLPPEPSIPQLYREWQTLYELVAQSFRNRGAIDIEPGGTTNVSEEDFSNICIQLKTSLNNWLETQPFYKKITNLCQRLDLEEDILVFIQTNDDALWRLPWHLWNFFEDYRHAEVILCPLKSTPVKPKSRIYRKQVNVLGILGNSEGINVKADEATLKQLPDANPKFLDKPKRIDINDQLWKQRWNIFFFSGHSSSEGIDINENQQNNSLTVSQLKNAVKKAVEQGLQLVILNSCDGLLLARDLVDLSVPQTIVMRERVPDLIAQEFLKDFLHRFAQEGKPLHLALREAREKLQGWEDETPCASWLPVICQNTTEVPPTWKQLRQGIKPDIPVQNFLKSVLVTSIVMTALVVGIRHLGWLEAIELKEFDRLVQLRPHEKPDPRILVVEATSDDMRQYDRLPDGILARAIKQLDRHQPLIIGLNIFRERPVAPGHAELATLFQNNKHLFTVCRHKDNKNPGIAPPSEVPEIERIGFADVVVDVHIDNILRRHLLFLPRDTNSPCKSDNAFSVLLALNYLNALGKKIEEERGDREGDKWLKLGTVVFKPLEDYAGGYQRLDSRGSQILLNYRWPEVAQRITLKQVLDGEIKSEWVKNKIVIIGVTDQESSGDHFYTSYSFSQRPYQEISGVIVQAQMVSQIISAAENNRPLLKVWPEWADVVWIWGWGVVGGMMVWWGRSRLIILVLGTGIIIITLWGSCFVILLFKGFWVPLVPSVLTVLANVCLMSYSLAKPQKTILNP